MDTSSSTHSTLTLTGVAMIVPYLLFSPFAGILADRFKKKQILVLAKFCEIPIVALGMICMYFEVTAGLYLAIFLIGLEGAILGPAKYGMIPELIPTASVPKANGLFVATAYLAIVVGPSLSALILDLSGRNFIVGMIFCLVVAFSGLCVSLILPSTDAQNSKRKIEFFFLKQLSQTLRSVALMPRMPIAIYGSSFMFFVGAFVQMNLVPFAAQSLQLNESHGGYLFTICACGIVIGAILIGKFYQQTGALWEIYFTGSMIGISLLLLYLFQFSLSMTFFSLVFFGFFGGICTVICDSFVQTQSPNDERGQIIAATNFFSFFSILVACFAIYLFGEVFQWTAAEAFICIGVLAFISSFGLRSILKKNLSS
jgi:acyl-[acyl-carrier-protein]-phospholipid O-acyltransferase/long-chain-fatty-acid--[acyl-carrier-protein] ligase